MDGENDENSTNERGRGSRPALSLRRSRAADCPENYRLSHRMSPERMSKSYDPGISRPSAKP